MAGTDDWISPDAKNFFGLLPPIQSPQPVAPPDSWAGQPAPLPEYRYTPPVPPQQFLSAIGAPAAPDAMPAVPAPPALSGPVAPPPTPPPSDDSLHPGETGDQYAERIRIKNQSDFGAGLDVGVLGLKQLGAGVVGALGQAAEGTAIGDALGAGEVHDWGVQKYRALEQEMQPYQEGRVSQLEQIESIGDVGRFAAWSVGQMAPSIVESIGSALVGAAAGSFVPGAGTAAGAAGGFFAKAATKKFLADYAVKEMAKDVTGKVITKEIADTAAKRALAQTVGAGAAMFASSYAMGVGDIYGETMDETGNGSVGMAALGALPYAALDAFTDLSVFKSILKGTGGDNALARFAKGILTAGAKEGSAEAGQEAILMLAGAQAGKEYDQGTVMSRLGNSFAAAAIGGGVLGVGAGRKGPTDQEREAGTLSALATVGLRTAGENAPVLNMALGNANADPAQRMSAVAQVDAALRGDGLEDLADLWRPMAEKAIKAKEPIQPTSVQAVATSEAARAVAAKQAAIRKGVPEPDAESLRKAMVAEGSKKAVDQAERIAEIEAGRKRAAAARQETPVPEVTNVEPGQAQGPVQGTVEPAGPIGVPTPIGAEPVDVADVGLQPVEGQQGPTPTPGPDVVLPEPPGISPSVPAAVVGPDVSAGAGAPLNENLTEAQMGGQPVADIGTAGTQPNGATGTSGVLGGPGQPQGTATAGQGGAQTAPAPVILPVTMPQPGETPPLAAEPPVSVTSQEVNKPTVASEPAAEPEPDRLALSGKGANWHVVDSYASKDPVKAIAQGVKTRQFYINEIKHRFGRSAAADNSSGTQWGLKAATSRRQGELKELRAQKKATEEWLKGRLPKFDRRTGDQIQYKDNLSKFFESGNPNDALLTTEPPSVPQAKVPPSPVAPKKRGRGRPGTQTQPAVSAAAEVGGVAPKRRGEVGGKLSAGEVVTTASGRETTPFPKFSTSTPRKAQNAVRKADRWLLENAALEAESRGDDFNAPMFRSALEDKTIPQATKDSAEEYLFGEQPPVVAPITRPLVQETAPTETPTPEVPSATEPTPAAEPTAEGGAAAAAPTPAAAPARTGPAAGIQPGVRAGVSGEEAKPAGITESLTKWADAQDREAEDWASRTYKKNKSQVELRGDGPSRNETLRIDTINERKRQKRVTSLRENARVARKYAATPDAQQLAEYTRIADSVDKWTQETLDMTGGISRADAIVMQLNEKLFGLHGTFGEGTPGGALARIMEPRRKAQADQAASEAKSQTEWKAKYEAMTPEEQAKEIDDTMSGLFGLSPVSEKPTPEVTPNAETLRNDQGPVRGQGEEGQPEVQPMPDQGGQDREQPAEQGGQGADEAKPVVEPAAKEPEAPPVKAAKASAKRMSYSEAVAKNLAHMGTPAEEWTATPITGMAATPDASGQLVAMPTFNLPSGYKQAPTLFPSGIEPNCELCATPIKNVYHIQNDSKKWLLNVGSECVTHFNSGESGEGLAKRVVHEQNRAFLRDIGTAKDTVELISGAPSLADWTNEQREDFYKLRDEANKLAHHIRQNLGNLHADDKTSTKTERGWKASADGVVTRFVSSKKTALSGTKRDAEYLVDRAEKLFGTRDVSMAGLNAVTAAKNAQETVKAALDNAYSRGWQPGDMVATSRVMSKDGKYYLTLEGQTALRSAMERAGWADQGTYAEVRRNTDGTPEQVPAVTPSPSWTAAAANIAEEIRLGLGLAVDATRLPGNEGAMDQGVAIAQGIVDRWRDALGITQSVGVVLDNTKPGASMTAMGATWRLTMPRDYLIALSSQEPMARATAVETLFHEFGHAVDHSMFADLAQHDQNALQDAYKVWRTKVDALSIEEARAGRLTPLRAAAATGETFPAQTVEYVLSEAEWRADNVARALLGRELLTTNKAAESVFGKVAAKIREAYKKLVAAMGYTGPDELIERLITGRLEKIERDAAARRMKARATVDPKNDNLLVAIAKMGGLSKDEAAGDFGDYSKKTVPVFGSPRVFRRDGLSFDDMAQQLAELHYPVTDRDGNYSTRALTDALDDALRGSSVMSVVGVETEGARLEQKRNEELAAQAELDDADIEAFNQETDASARDAFNLEMRHQAVDLLGMDPAEYDDIAAGAAAATDGGTQEDYETELSKRVGAARSARQSGQGQARPGNAQAPEALTLEGQTNADILAAEESKRQRERDAVEAERRRMADEELPGFVLSGSDRAVDQAEARGQTSLFDQPIAKPESAVGQETTDIEESLAGLGAISAAGFDNMRKEMDARFAQFAAKGHATPEGRLSSVGLVREIRRAGIEGVASKTEKGIFGDDDRVINIIVSKSTRGTIQQKLLVIDDILQRVSPMADAAFVVLQYAATAKTIDTAVYAGADKPKNTKNSRYVAGFRDGIYVKKQDAATPPLFDQPPAPAATMTWQDVSEAVAKHNSSPLGKNFPVNEFELDDFGLDPREKTFSKDAVYKAISRAAKEGRDATKERTRTALIEANGGTSVGLELKHKDRDSWAAILPDASEPGRFRYSLYDKRGFFTHATFDTAPEALDEAIKDGYTERDQGAMDRLQETPEFQQGMDAAWAIQKENAESWMRSQSAKAAPVATDTKAEAAELRRRATDLRKQAAEVNAESKGRAAKGLVDINADGSYVPVAGRAAQEFRRLRAEADSLTKRANALDPIKAPVNTRLQIRTIKTEAFPGGSQNGMRVTNIPQRTLDALGWKAVWFKPGVPQRVFAQEGKYPDEYRDELIFEGEIGVAGTGLVEAINRRLDGETAPEPAIPPADMEGAKFSRSNRAIPDVDWNAKDNYGYAWTKQSVAKHVGVKADEYVYRTEVNADDLKPNVVEYDDEKEIRAGRKDDEVEDFHKDEARQLLEQYNEESFYNPELDEYRGWLVYDFSEDDVLDLAREIAARGYDENNQDRDLALPGTPPPVVLTRTKEGTYEVVDGNHRVDYWKRAGFERIPAWVNDEYARLRGDTVGAKYSATPIISPTGRVQPGETPRGVSIADVQDMVSTFGNRMLGATAGRVPVLVFATQAQALGPGSVDKEGRIKGAFLPNSRQIILIAENLDSLDDARTVFRHEAMHYGTLLLSKEEKTEFLNKVREATKRNRSLGRLWTQIEEAERPGLVRRLKDATPAERADIAADYRLRIAEEVFARTAESGRTNLGVAWDKLLVWLRGVLRKYGLIEGRFGPADMRLMAADFAKGIREGREQKIFPETDRAQFATSDRRLDETDKAYLAAVERGDMETAQRMVDAEAVRKGYVSANDYRMAHSAPDRESYNLSTIQESDLVPQDYWTRPDWYQGTPEEMESWGKVNRALNRSKESGRTARFTVYRAVPKTSKESAIRNGDWVTPSESYARSEGQQINEGYRIISMTVPINRLWWDGNSIAELGYDDGKEYAYKNTKNNRKLMDPVTRDDDGNVIPLSQRFNLRNEDIRYSFAGERAQTADKMALETAQARLAVGDDAETVRKETGWFKNDDDGKWRFEIDDSTARLLYHNANGLREATGKAADFSIGEPAKLSDVLEHPSLFAAYPQLRDMNFMFTASKGAESGSYNKATNTINVDPRMRSDEGILSTLLHEVQHGIQTIEGFARGGSQSNAGELARQLAEELYATGKPTKAFEARAEAQAADYAWLAKTWRDNPERLTRSQTWYKVKGFGVPRKGTKERAAYMADAVERAIQMLQDDLEGYDLRRFQEAMQKTPAELQRRARNAWARLSRSADARARFEALRDVEHSKDPAVMLDFYHRLSGEVEARNVQTRQGLTAAERLAKSPNETRDVPASDVIVVWNGKEMASAPRPENAGLTEDTRLRDLLSQYANVEGSPSEAAITEAVRQYRQVEADNADVLASGNPLPAPNGKPSNLNREQWILVRTPNFKRWFGESKVVDANGEPLVIHHGTDATQFFVFDPSKGSEHGIYATPKAGYASQYGRRTELLFANIRNPKTVEWKGEISPADLTKNDIDALRAKGFDGIINASEGRPVWRADEIVAFDPEQVKSSTGNIGTYSTRGDIRFSRAPTLQSDASAQTAYLEQNAKRLGYADPDDLLVKNPAEFIALAEQWRDGHPRTDELGAVMFSRVPTKKGALSVENIVGTPWSALQDGVPADVFVYRGEGGNPQRSLLTDKYQAQLGRKYLLGDGVYVTSTVSRATNYGQYRVAQVSFKKPYVIGRAGIDDVRKLDIEKIKREGYDGIVLQSGRTVGNEDITQAVIFPEYASGIVYHDKIPPYALAKGAKFIAPFSLKGIGDAPAISEGDEVKITGFSHWGHVEVINKDGIKGSFIFDKLDEARKSGARYPAISSDGVMFSRVVPDWVEPMSATYKEAAARLNIIKNKQTVGEWLADARLNFGKKMIQGVFDGFAPIKEFSNPGYMLARLSNTAPQGTLEAAFMNGLPTMGDDGALDVTEDMRHAFLPFLRKFNGEHDRFFGWVAGNRADEIVQASNRATRRAAQLKSQIARLRHDRLEAIKAGQSAVVKMLEADIREAAKHRKTAMEQAGITERNLSADQIIALQESNQGQMDDGADRETFYNERLVEFNAMLKAYLDVAEKAGLIDGASRHIWERDFYVPFYRDIEEGRSGPTISSGLGGQYAFKRLKGGPQATRELLENIVGNWSHLLAASAKNRAMQEVAKDAVATGIARVVPARRVRIAGKKPNYITYRDNGREINLEVDDPMLFNALAAVNYTGLKGPVMTVLSKAKRYLTVGVTANPAFKFYRNMMRDAVTSIAVSELGYVPWKNAADGIKALNSPLGIHLMAGGGQMRFGTSWEGEGSLHIRRLIDAGVDPSTILSHPDKILNFWKSIWEKYQEAGDKVENMNRAALYKLLREQGKTHLEASHAALDLMDFSLHGIYPAVRLLTQIVPFMNARLQGLYKLGRAAHENPKRMATVAGAATLASIALLLAYKDDDDWKKREDWDRENFYWFKVGQTAFRIPMPFELGAIGSIVERGLETFIADDFTKERFFERLGAIVGNQLAMNPVPQLVKPMLDVYANRDSFTGRPIETMGMERLQPQDRYTERTSEVARQLGKANVLSPAQIDNLIRGYFGWIGSTTTLILDQAARPAFGRPSRPETPMRSWTGGIAEDLANDPVRSRYVSQFYDQATKIEQAYASQREAARRGDFSRAGDFDANAAALAHAAGRTKKILTTLNTRKKEVERDAGMSPDAKAREIARLNERMSEVAARVRIPE